MTLAAALLLSVQVQAGPAVVVLPPEGAAASPAWIGAVVADVVPRDLALLGVPAVDRADLLRAREALAIPPVPLTRASSIRLAEALGAGRLLVGTYAVDESRTLTVSLRLIDVERGTLSAPLRARGPVEKLAELTHGLAWDIALAGPTAPTGTRQQLLAGKDASFEALRAYGQGLLAPDAASRIRLLKQALALAPAFDAAKLALARLELDAGDPAAASETLARVPAASPLGRRARFQEGLALLALGRYRDAAALYGTLAAQDETPAVLNNQAAALLRVPGGARASDVLRKAVELLPGLPDLPFNLGWALLREGDAEAATFWLRGVLRDSPGDAHARVVLVWALRRLGRTEEADEEWKTLLATAPSYQTLAEPDLGRRFERILPSEHPFVPDPDARSDAELAAVHVGRAEKLREAGDPDGALRELDQAAYLDPHDARVHLLLARAHAGRGETEAAWNEFKTSLWCREDAAVRLELAQSLKDAGRVAEARAEARKVLEREPGNAAARSLLQRER